MREKRLAGKPAGGRSREGRRHMVGVDMNARAHPCQSGKQGETEVQLNYTDRGFGSWQVKAENLNIFEMDNSTFGNEGYVVILPFRDG